MCVCVFVSVCVWLDHLFCACERALLRTEDHESTSISWCPGASCRCPGCGLWTTEPREPNEPSEPSESGLSHAAEPNQPVPFAAAEPECAKPSERAEPTKLWEASGKWAGEGWMSYNIKYLYTYNTHIYIYIYMYIFLFNYILDIEINQCVYIYVHIECKHIFVCNTLTNLPHVMNPHARQCWFIMYCKDYIFLAQSWFNSCSLI